MKKKNADKYDGIAYVGLFSTIEAQSAEELVDTISNKLPDNTHTIYMLMCVSGGNVQHGLAIFNFLKGLPYKIIMHNIGSVDSIANVIFLAGDERYATENGTFLIHRVSSRMKDNLVTTSFIKEKLSCIKSDEDRISEIMTTYTKMSMAEHKQLFEYGEVKDAQYALEKGMIHAVKEIKIPPMKRIIVIKGGISGGD